MDSSQPMDPSQAIDQSQPIDVERQRQAREYARIQRPLILVELGIGLAYLALLLADGISVWLRDQVLALGLSTFLAAAIFIAIVGAVYGLLTFPIGYYGGHLLPRRYGLSVQTTGAWLLDWLKAALIGGALTLLLGEVVYALLIVLPGFWWLAMAVVMLVFSVVLAQLAPVLLLPLFYKLTPVESALAERLRRLAERAGAQVRGVYSMNMSAKTTAANAALTGLGRTRRIILGDTLLDRYPAAEIEVIFAHELGHHVHGDIAKSVAVSSATSLVGLYLVDLFLRWGVGALGFRSIADLAALPLLVLGLGAYGLVTMPLGNGYSRRAESAADDYALATTNDPTAFAAAMRRLASQNLAELNPPRWVELMLHDHPALGRRIARAEAFARARAEPAPTASSGAIGLDNRSRSSESDDHGKKNG